MLADLVHWPGCIDWAKLPKKKKLVMKNRPPDARAKVIQLIVRLFNAERVIRPCVRVQIRVSEIFVKTSMKLVRSPAGNEIDLH